MIINNKTKKLVETSIYNYYHPKKKITREEVFTSSPNLDGMPRGSNISNPTLQKTLKLLEIDEEELWNKVIECAINYFINHDDEKVDLIIYTYRDELTDLQISRKLNVDRSTYYDWRNEVIYYIVFLAIQVGLIELIKPQELKK